MEAVKNSSFAPWWTWTLIQTSHKNNSKLICVTSDTVGMKLLHKRTPTLGFFTNNDHARFAVFQSTEKSKLETNLYFVI